MAAPKPWSHTALDTFENCPRQYYGKYLDPDRVKEPPTKEMLWGRTVHKHFEDFLLKGTPLPADLSAHEKFLSWFKALPGDLAGEEDINLDRQLQPCGKWDKQIWYRGVVDARKVTGTLAFVIDHKTGKVKNDFAQLEGFAFHTFRANPHIRTVRAGYYWTQTQKLVEETYDRSEMWDLLRRRAPALKRYVEAFESGVFVPKPSGLCKGWCPVTTCEYWQPKRPGR